MVVVRGRWAGCAAGCAGRRNARTGCAGCGPSPIGGAGGPLPRAAVLSPTKIGGISAHLRIGDASIR
eukprot:5607360-Alexandrium_andersonii.AAC.1